MNNIRSREDVIVGLRTKTDPSTQIFVEMPRASKAMDDVLLLVLFHEEQVEHLKVENKSIECVFRGIIGMLMILYYEVFN